MSMKLKYLGFVVLLLLTMACQKNEAEPEKPQFVTAKINGIDYSIVRNKVISLSNGVLTISGDDWVNNHLEFEVSGIQNKGQYQIMNAKFSFADNPTVDYTAENDQGKMEILEISDEKLLAEFEMILINSTGTLAEITEGSINVEF